jgi:fatty acid desaturase
MTNEDENERIEEFGRRIDAIRARVEAAVGPADLAHVEKMRAISRGLEITGRTLIHVSLDPVTWSVGVGALWLHKQLEATEIGHTALHGAFDKIEGAPEDLQSRTFHWRVPIDEESWRHGHNVKHHQYTNIMGRDPDLEFGPIRLSDEVPHERHHYWQAATSLLAASHFAFGMNTHFTGLEDVARGKVVDKAAKQDAWRRSLRKWVPYYAKELVFFPAIAGPMFWKVLLGNYVTELMRDLYSAATIFCGHIGDDVAAYPEGTKAGGRGRWYKMQVEGANNFEVPYVLSLLCGALDRQIEHHLFPKFPTNRIREIAPEVKQACIDCGVEYKTDTWPRTLAKVAKRIWQLSFPTDKDRARKAQATAQATTRSSTAQGMQSQGGEPGSAVMPMSARSPLASALPQRAQS